ncbi:anaerobic ribonucleoside-triphosphate reductase activating protein [Candidatus Woesearchaeota archaeon]|nr:anaerobic ribonucleoside-triphosphate reductase activating protein [Candidatus Woesearchaeota archaeon]
MQAFIAEIIPAGGVEFTNELYTKIYFSGCDFKCPYCNTPDMLETKFEHQIDLREVKRELENQRGTVEGVLLTGGEPCFQKQALLEVLRKAKELELKTVLDTNGSKPEVIEALLKNELIDIIIMDFKAPFNQDFDKVTKSSTFFKPAENIMEDIKQTLQILKSYDEKVEIVFKTTIVPGLVFRKEDLLKMAEEIEGINAVWELQAFRSGVVTDRMYREINSPTNSFLENLRDAVKKEIPDINIRLK